MKKSFYLLFLLAHILLFISFQTSLPFWVIFSISFFILAASAIVFGTYDWEDFSIKTSIIAILSGILMYALFYIGKLLSSFLFPSQLGDVAVLYNQVQPKLVWHYLALFLIIIPGEELFWRGYIQKKLSDVLNNKFLIVIIAALCYTSANLYTWNPLFLLATFAGGVVWGTLYMWKRNIVITIMSHVVFNLLLLVILPIF